jgi:transposase
VSTSAEETEAATDALGRRTAPRRSHTPQEKLRIVQETHVPGASVAIVARRHDVNPNQVFAWRQLYRRGRLAPKVSDGDAQLLPVTVETPTVLPTERVRRSAPRSERAQGSGPLMEIRLSNGHSVALYAEVDTELLARVLKLMVRR